MGGCELDLREEAHALGLDLLEEGDDGLLGLVGAVLFSLLAGYAKGQERRITVVEHELKQLQSVVYNQPSTIQRDHPSRHEFEGLRADMHRGFDELKALLRESR
mgnify:CR=1 FL=1